MPVVILAFIIILIVTLSDCSDDSSSYDSYKPDESSVAHVCAKNEVKKELFSPSSADFPWSSQTVKNSDGSYSVKSYVDSQNAFGAVLRTEYICDVEIISARDYECDTQCHFL